MKNILKLFAIMMLMVTFVVTGCQSNEKKYTELKTDTEKVMAVLDEKDKKIEKEERAKAKRGTPVGAIYIRQADECKEEVNKIKSNVKAMEELTKSEVKLSNDLKLFKEKTDHVIYYHSEENAKQYR